MELRGSEPGRPVVASSSFEKDEGSDPIAWWVGNEAKIYFQDRDYALLLETEDPGGGDKIIIFDPESGKYTTRDLDEDILAASPHETALIAQMEEAGWVEGLQGYGFTGVGVPYTYVEFDLQRMKITLLDAETGVPYAETILCAGYPDSVAVGTQHETAWVGQGMINNWLREQLESYLAARG